MTGSQQDPTPMTIGGITRGTEGTPSLKLWTAMPPDTYFLTIEPTWTDVTRLYYSSRQARVDTWSLDT